MMNEFENAGLSMTSPTAARAPRRSWGFPAAVLVRLLAAWALRRRAVRRLGGVTRRRARLLSSRPPQTAALVACAIAA